MSAAEFHAEHQKWRVWPTAHIVAHVENDHGGKSSWVHDSSRDYHAEHQQLHADAADHRHFWPKHPNYAYQRKTAPNGYGA